MKYINDNNLLSTNQHGFLHHKSCVTNLIGTFDIISFSLASHQFIDVVYLDFAKAVDSVPHTRLMLKLKSFGINGKLLQWINSFLVSRKQRVTINNTSSDWVDVLSGVPQSSVLGPLLFILFTSDLAQLTKTSEVFADDTKLFSKTSSQTNFVDLQDRLHLVYEWSNTWLLKLNISKCCVIHYGKTNPMYSYFLQNNQGINESLRSSVKERDLGVIFTSNLKWSTYIQSVVSKFLQILGMLKRTFTIVNEKMALKLYKVPHLECAVSVWAPYLKTGVALVESVQRKATKWALNLRNLQYYERLKRLNLPSLEFRRLRCDLIQIFKLPII